LQACIKDHIEAGSALYSDALKSYDGLAQDYAHQVIDHAEKYVDGQIHTNGLDNFWSLLKRGISGSYVSVEPFHLFRYLDEQVFRYNNRATKKSDVTDSDRFDMAVRKIFGKRLTFASLTGKTAYATPF
jgi:transposase-like protein